MENYYYDELGNLVRIKKKINIIPIILIIASIIAACCIAVSLYFKFSNYEIKKAIETNISHIENKDIDGYMSDLSSKLSDNERAYTRNLIETQFNKNITYKIIIKNIKVQSKKGNNATVLVKIQKKFIISKGNTKSLYYTLKHKLIKEHGKYKFYKSFIVINDK